MASNIKPGEVLVMVGIITIIIAIIINDDSSYFLRLNVWVAQEGREAGEENISHNTNRPDGDGDDNGDGDETYSGQSKMSQNST